MDTITQKLLEQRASFALRNNAAAVKAAAEQRDAARFNA